MDFINGILALSEQSGFSPDILMFLHPFAVVLAWQFYGWCFRQLTRLFDWTLRKLSRTARLLLKVHFQKR